MEELNPNFLTATNCEAFKLTSKMLKEILEKAKIAKPTLRLFTTPNY
jgi:hypothetical protein